MNWKCATTKIIKLPWNIEIETICMITTNMTVSIWFLLLRKVSLILNWYCSKIESIKLIKLKKKSTLVIWIKDTSGSWDVPELVTSTNKVRKPSFIPFEIALPPLDESQEDHPRTSRSIPYIPDQDDESIPIHAFKYLKLYLTYHTDSEIFIMVE